jgi:hypothetical protein
MNAVMFNLDKDTLHYDLSYSCTQDHKKRRSSVLNALLFAAGDAYGEAVFT